MGSSVPVTSKERFSRWLGLTMLFLGAALLITWWIPSRTKVHFYLANAPQVEGDRRSLEVALSEPGWLWAKVWRQPDSTLTAAWCTCRAAARSGRSVPRLFQASQPTVVLFASPVVAF